MRPSLLLPALLLAALEPCASVAQDGVFGMLVRGGAMVVPAGTLATARTAVDVDLPATEPTAAPAEAQTEEENNEGEEDVSQTT